jgi:hypothetical protein
MLPTSPNVAKSLKPSKSVEEIRGQPSSRHPLHRCALRPTLSNGYHLEAPQVRWRGEVGRSTLGPLRTMHDRWDMMGAVLMKHCASHLLELPAFTNHGTRV